MQLFIVKMGFIGVNLCLSCVLKHIVGTRVPTIYVLSKRMTFFHLKITYNLTAVKNRSILHERVIVMQPRTCRKRY